jgi:SAM-dependent methyltransferase
MNNVMIRLIFIFCAIVFFCAPYCGAAEKKKVPQGQKISNHLSPDRIALMKPDQLVRLINPPAKGKILDFGAGYGLYTFPLAEAAGKTSTVYATDVDEEVIAYLSEQAGKKGLSNVVPVQVIKKGLDHFYRQHEFDVILMSDVIGGLSIHKEAENIVAQLKNSLKKESGRFWLVIVRIEPDFTTAEFPDRNALRTALVSLAPHSPIMRRLGEKFQQVLAGPASPANDELLAESLVSRLNTMLDDSSLWPEYQAYPHASDVWDEKLRDSLVRFIEKEGLYKQGGTDSNPKVRIALRHLNRLLIQDELNNHSWQKIFAITKQRKEDKAFILDRLKVGQDFPQLFAATGYTLVKQHHVLPYHHVWEFKRQH